MTPLQRLLTGYYNSGVASEANPGGFADGGHVVNFPAALADLGAVADGIVLDADAIAGAGEKAAQAAASAEAAGAARDEASLIASGRTVRSGVGAPAAGLGRDGDYYIDSVEYRIYGPKALGAWGDGTSMLSPELELGVVEGAIVWRLGGGVWIELCPLAALKGADAAQISIDISATHVRWRREGGEWLNLIALVELEGDAAEQISLQKSATHIQWRRGADPWTDLVQLSDLQANVTFATTAQVRAGKAAIVSVSPGAAAGAMTLTALTDAATVAIDLDAGPNFSLATTAGVGVGRTLGLPTNGNPGQFYTFTITADAAGRTLAYHTAFKWPAAKVEAIATTVGAVTVMSVRMISAARFEVVGFVKDIR